MTDKDKAGQSQAHRNDRLRAALRANLARRKAQARARAAQQDQADEVRADTGETEGDE